MGRGGTSRGSSAGSPLIIPGTRAPCPRLGPALTRSCAPCAPRQPRFRLSLSQRGAGCFPTCSPPRARKGRPRRGSRAPLSPQQRHPLPHPSGHGLRACGPWLWDALAHLWGGAWGLKCAAAVRDGPFSNTGVGEECTVICVLRGVPGNTCAGRRPRVAGVARCQMPMSTRLHECHLASDTLGHPFATRCHLHRTQRSAPVSLVSAPVALHVRWGAGQDRFRPYTSPTSGLLTPVLRCHDDLPARWVTCRTCGDFISHSPKRGI